jgi:Tfp pilus tip-associated adhesin PilY1
VRPSTDYTVAKTIIETQLTDITDTLAPVPATSKGWKIELRRPSWRGEKVLAESVTANGIIFFPTFVPLAPDPAKPCLAQTLNRLYAVYALSGKPAIRWSDTSTAALGVDDRATDLATGGIAPSLSIYADPIGSIRAGSSTSSSGSTSSSSSSSSSTSGGCMVALEDVKKCVKMGAVRSFWEHR